MRECPEDEREDRDDLHRSSAPVPAQQSNLSDGYRPVRSDGYSVRPFSRSETYC